MTIDLIQFARDYGPYFHFLGSLGLGAIVAAWVGRGVQRQGHELSEKIAHNDVALRRDLGQGDLELRRRVETVKVFLEISQRAALWPDPDDRGSADHGDKIAAVYLLADLATRDPWLARAGENYLDQNIDHLSFTLMTAAHQKSLAYHAVGDAKDRLSTAREAQAPKRECEELSATYEETRRVLGYWSIRYHQLHQIDGILRDARGRIIGIKETQPDYKWHQFPRDSPEH